MSTPFHKEQSGSLFWTLKLALLEDKALILPDFAGTSRMQFRGITGTLNSHATLNLFVVHRRNNQILTVESFCVISNHMKHNSNAVHAFLGKVLNLLKHSWSTLQKCIYFSDGAALQYKNYKNFDICYHTMVRLSTCCWVAFLCFVTWKNDGIWGTVKRLVANASLQSLKQPIETPEKTFLWCKNNIKGIRFWFMSHSDVVNHASELKLEKRYESWSTALSTQSYHTYVPTSISIIEMRRVSFDIISITHRSQTKKITWASLTVYLGAILHAFMMIGSLEIWLKSQTKTRTLN